MPSETLSLALLVLMSIVFIAMLALLYHKLSGAIDRLGKQMPLVGDNLFKQLEALQALKQELQLAHALPATRGWAASPDLLRLLMEHALSQLPEVMVECSSGVSTLVLARCAQLNGRGHVYSLEHDAVYGQKTRELLRRHGLSDYATVIDAGLQPYRLNDWQGDWYGLEGLPSDLRIDMLAIDGPPWFVADAARYPALPLLIERFAPNAAVFLDDADRDDERWAVARWLKDYPQLHKIEPQPQCEKGCTRLALRTAGTAAP